MTLRPARRARPGPATTAGRVLLGGGVALALAHLPPPGGHDRWQRSNHRGRTVSLTSGPALAVAAGAAGGLTQPAAAVTGVLSALLGAYDDLAGSVDKGLRGHLAALRRGQVTTGALKVAGLSGTGLLGVALLPGRRILPDLLVSGAVVAGAGNLVNLLDLRAGRALKVALLAATVLRAPGVAGAVLVLLPEDLRERQMLGDAGANSIGALLGLAVVERSGPRGRRTALAVLVALTAASERVSYSAVIDAHPVLRRVDQLGRLP